MKIINTDFTNLNKKTIYDFGDTEAIDTLLKDQYATREQITQEFFDNAETIVRFTWMRNLAEVLLHADPNAKEFFIAVEKEIERYRKDRDKRAQEGYIAD